MLDHFFYFLDGMIVKEGPDNAILCLFASMAGLPLLIFAAHKLPRVLQAVFIFIGSAVVTYFPCTMMESLLDTVYIHTGLISSWYVSSVPFLIRFPTLWLFALLFSTGTWFFIALSRDLVKRNPITTIAIADKSYSDAVKLEKKIIEDRRAGKTNRMV